MKIVLIQTQNCELNSEKIQGFENQNHRFDFSFDLIYL